MYVNNSNYNLSADEGEMQRRSRRAPHRRDAGGGGVGRRGNLGGLGDVRVRRRGRPMVQRQLAEMVHGVAFWCTPRVGAHAATDAGRASPMGRNIAEMVRGG